MSFTAAAGYTVTLDSFNPAQYSTSDDSVDISVTGGTSSYSLTDTPAGGLATLPYTRRTRPGVRLPSPSPTSTTSERTRSFTAKLRMPRVPPSPQQPSWPWPPWLAGCFSSLPPGVAASSRSRLIRPPEPQAAAVPSRDYGRRGRPQELISDQEDGTFAKSLQAKAHNKGVCP